MMQVYYKNIKLFLSLFSILIYKCTYVPLLVLQTIQLELPYGCFSSVMYTHTHFKGILHFRISLHQVSILDP